MECLNKTEATAFKKCTEVKKNISKRIPIENINSIKNIKINPYEIDNDKSFKDEIPQQLLYRDYLHYLLNNGVNSWLYAKGQQTAWDNICTCAQNLDSKLLRQKNQKPTFLTFSSRTLAKQLKAYSIDYIDKYKDNIEDGNYSGANVKKLIATKLSLVARKMINKVVYECENSGSFKGVDKHGKEIEEGAENVTLVLGKNFRSGIAIQNTNLHYRCYPYKELFEHEPTALDCRQLDLGDCWLQSALISLLNMKGSEPIKDIFKDEGDSGYVRVRLYYPKDTFDDQGNKIIDESALKWKPKYYRVRKQIPVDRNDFPVYNGGANWVHYLQAAIAKSNIINKISNYNLTQKTSNDTKIRNYSSIEGGHAYFLYCMMLGNDAKIIKKEFIDFSCELALYNEIKSALDNHKLVDLSLDPLSFKCLIFNKKANNDRGLVFDHSYSVRDCVDENGTKYIRLINPWHLRSGRKYENYENDGKKGKNGRKYEVDFIGQGDESFKVKVSTVLRHLRKLFISE